MSTAALATPDRIRIRACVNEWISDKLPRHRKHLRHTELKFVKSRNLWRVKLNDNESGRFLGFIFVAPDASVADAEHPDMIAEKIERLLEKQGHSCSLPGMISDENYRFVLGDGVAAAEQFEDGQVDLLLTDPPYGISKEYTCEKQVPRRLRSDGRDFIMPRGHFGDWDSVPIQWLDVVLPKIGGWAVSFCSHAQIGQYQEIFARHKFVAIGAMVWEKTNPVPFNHKFKPINAWEAIVVGKRPGAKFNGHFVRNVFLCKSPSPRARVHPTQKPLPLLEEFVSLFTDPGDLVFDPFGGAATSLIAAAKHQRRAVSYELNREIYQIAGKRILECLR